MESITSQDSCCDEYKWDKNSKRGAIPLVTPFGEECRMECKCDEELVITQQDVGIQFRLFLILLDCSDGYFGINCERKCRYPNYGAGCQEPCRCMEEMCNHISGCQVCADGYFGQNCTLPCRFPNYGAGCQDECICLERICDPVTGCMTTCNVFRTMQLI
ncbi:multiple epidermal growth factor-like domains protein 10 [Saccostrea echinata]|uniref:multiple epidermal growth factor-like domains protein 10 n=1 Tax=Saccostrea echinata TaxID=191078 RepID=UPI002A80687F|nr:multiple epidermal growth factor-like domains protein 10 [Saccostrea echinata]